MHTSIPTYLYLNFVCNLDCKFCASDETNATKQRRWFTLKQIKEIFNNDYFARYPSSLLFISGGEPTVHPEFLPIARYLKTRFQSIHLMTNGVKLSDTNYLRSVIESGICNFSTPLYGDRTLHDSLTRKSSYDLTYKFFRSMYERRLNGEGVYLDIKLLFTKHNYEFNPLLMRQLLQEFGGMFSYSLNGLFRSKKVIINDSYVPFFKIRKYITETIVALKDARLPIRLSFVPLCSIDYSILREILLDLYVQTIVDSKFVYYVRPDSTQIRLFSNSTSENPKCKSCDVYEICSKFSGINSRYFEIDEVYPVKL